MTSLTTQTNKVITVANNISTIVSAAASSTGDIAQKIERGIQRFADDLPWLMKALDEVARIHPVVTGMLLALLQIYAPLTQSAKLLCLLSRRCMRSKAHARRTTAA